MQMTPSDPQQASPGIEKATRSQRKAIPYSPGTKYPLKVPQFMGTVATGPRIIDSSSKEKLNTSGNPGGLTNHAFRMNDRALSSFSLQQPLIPYDGTPFVQTRRDIGDTTTSLSVRTGYHTSCLEYPKHYEY